MPNWIVHLGLQYGVGKAIPQRFRDMTLFMLGAITPDIASVILIGMLDVLNVQKHFDFLIWYFQPFHTPFMSVLIGAFLALILKGPKWAYFLSFSAGALLHFLLDMTQKHIGFHLLIAYPFSFGNYNLRLFFPDHTIYYVLTGLSLCILLAVLFLEKERSHVDYKRIFDPKSGRVAFLLLVVILTLPFLTRDLFFKNNFHYLEYFMDRRSFEGQKIELCVSEIVSVAPLRVSELNKVIELDYHGPENLKVGDKVSLSGVLSQGVLKVDFLKRHTSYSFKRITSIMGFFLFVLIIINAETGVFKWHARTRRRT